MKYRGYEIVEAARGCYRILFNGNFVGYANSYAHAGRRIDETLETEALIAKFAA